VSGHSQKVADLGWLGFWSRQIAKHPGMTAILVPDSNTMKDRTPLWHNKQRQVGAGRPLERHQVVSGVAPSKVADSCSDFGLVGLQNTLA